MTKLKLSRLCSSCLCGSFFTLDSVAARRLESENQTDSAAESALHVVNKIEEVMTCTFVVYIWRFQFFC
jgi:hypothetical protein